MTPRYSVRKGDLHSSPGWEVYRDGWFRVDVYATEEMAVAYVEAANNANGKWGPK